MVYPDKLFELAYQYKKTNIWKDLYDTDIFAIRLENGEYGYISVLGHAGQMIGMNIYIGDEGFNSYRKLYTDYCDTEGDDPERIYIQSCLQVSFDTKDFFSEEEFQDVASYNKRHHIRTKTYPNFMKYVPCCEPWMFYDESEHQVMEQALTSVNALAKALEKMTPQKFGIHSMFSVKNDVLLVSVDEEGNIQKHGYIPQPEYQDEEYPVIEVKDTTYLDNIRMFPQRGIYECGIVYIPNSVLSENKQEPAYFPACLLMANRATGNVLPVNMVAHLKENMDTLLVNAMEAMETYSCYPKILRCEDERTYSLLYDFASKMNIKISIYERPMKQLNRVKDYFSQSLSQEELDTCIDNTYEIVRAILQLPDHELMNLPEQLRQELLHAAQNHILEADLCEQILDKFQRRKIS